MGIISRHANWPYANGESLEGPDLEQDISNVYGAINGNLDNANIAAAANIAGSKLADGTVTLAKLATDLALNQGRIAADACSKHGFAAADSVPITANGSEQDVLSVALSTAVAAGPVLIDFSCRGQSNNIASAEVNNITWKLYRDAVELDSWSWNLSKQTNGSGGYIILPETVMLRFVDTGASNGVTHTYKITATPVSSAVNPTIANAALRVVELRR